jgi:hypothetical protein
MRKIWAKEEDNYIINNYKKESCKNIAKKLSRSYNSVKRRANLLGIKKHNQYNKWTEKEIKLLKKLFPVATKKEIMCKIKRPWTAIRKMAVKNGIRRLNRYKMPPGIDHSFFDKWSDEMAYILGFIAADGNVSKNRFKLGIKLSTKDKEHLIAIRNLVAPKNKIYVSKNKSCVSLEICSKYMCNRLVTLGVTPRKSLTLKFPEMPRKYIKHFIRGYFDGDGCISKTKTTSVWCSYFLGTKNMLENINKYINESTLIGNKNVRYVKQSNIYKISYSTHDSIKLGNWMYENSSIYLKRKRDKFKQLLYERNQF